MNILSSELRHFGRILESIEPIEIHTGILMKTAVALLAAVLLTAGCDQNEKEASKVAQAESVDSKESIYASAVANTARSQADRERDPNRKPDKVLEFFNIDPGMQVLDLFSGGGYYSELVSYVVGDTGRVTAHSNETYAEFVGDEVITRYGGDRLQNVQILMAENNEMKLDADAYDAALMILAFHDIFYVDVKNGWPKIDGPKLLAELYRGLKPGGILGVVDHFADAGSSRETGGTLHRIDPAIVIADLEAAGFVLEEKSDTLRNLSDDYSKHMADPAVRGKTDRFVLRFVKPNVVAE